MGSHAKDQWFDRSGAGAAGRGPDETGEAGDVDQSDPDSFESSEGPDAEDVLDEAAAYAAAGIEVPGGEIAEDGAAPATAEAAEYRDALMRVKADFDNYRKRVARDAESQATRAAEGMVQELLPVLDNLERALDASEHHEEAKVAEGVALVRQQLVDLLARRGLEPIEASPGDRFDPHVHDALSQQPSEHPEGAIAAVWQRGYRLGDRVVRPARVVVSGGPGSEG
jgi:molecular chaperone GrpE